MNIHFRDDCPEAVVPVVVALDENVLAVQSLFKLPILIYSPFLPAFEDEIAQKENRIVRLNSFVMPFDDRFIHFLSRLKKPFAIANNVEVRKVII